MRPPNCHADPHIPELPPVGVSVIVSDPPVVTVVRQSVPMIVLEVPSIVEPIWWYVFDPSLGVTRVAGVRPTAKTKTSAPTTKVCAGSVIEATAAVVATPHSAPIAEMAIGPTLQTRRCRTR